MDLTDLKMKLAEVRQRLEQERLRSKAEREAQGLPAGPQLPGVQWGQDLGKKIAGKIREKENRNSTDIEVLHGDRPDRIPTWNRDPSDSVKRFGLGVGIYGEEGKDGPGHMGYVERPMSDEEKQAIRLRDKAIEVELSRPPVAEAIKKVGARGMGRNDISGVEALYEDPGTGQLHVGADGRAFRVQEVTPERTSRLSATLGPIGTPFSSGTPQSSQPPPNAGLGGSQVARPRPMTHQELMAWADANKERIQAATAAIAQQRPSVGPSDGPPQWLQNYMASQPPTDPYHPAPERKTLEDNLKENKFKLSEEEKQKYRDFASKRK